MKNLKVKKIKIKKEKIWDFFVKTSPTRRSKYKMINFAPINKSIMTCKLPWINLEQFLIDFISLTR